VLTVAEAKTSRLKRVCGCCVDSQDFIDLLNDSTRELIRRGNWWATVKTLRGCIYNQCITWPRQAGTVLAFNRCGSAPPKNFWFSYDSVLPNTFINGTNSTHLRALLISLWLIAAPVRSSTRYLRLPWFLRLYVTQPTDVGKTITIFGKVER
jgi:hypothetical protein